MAEKLTAVYAGTAVDTEMGVVCLKERGIPAKAYPVSTDPVAQTVFQNSSQEQKDEKMKGLLRQAADEGCERYFVYCNSLSGSIDFSAIGEELGISIVTPLQVYKQLAGNYHKLGIICANANGIIGVERTMLAANPDLDILSAGMLSVVVEIEKNTPPDELVAKHHLGELAAWFKSNGCEALVLGCTHFPYFKDALAKVTDLPLIDPADGMVSILREN